MLLTNQIKNQHLLWRSGFGFRIEDLDLIRQKTPQYFIDEIFKQTKKTPPVIEVANSAFDGLVKGIGSIINMSKKDLGNAEKRRMQQMDRQAIQTLNYNWYATMIDAKDQLTEKMAFFWHGHFACKIVNIYYQQLLLEIIRNNALGNFGDLLREVSKSAAMINFLNNQQNRKQKPNENFAREILELFTMGRGNYMEKDIKEAARAFTGWTTNSKGEFQFNKNVHDSDHKTFLGKSGKLDGDDIIDIILEQKETARYLIIKIWKFFVNETLADGDLIDELTESFYKSNYDIKALMKTIFNADWFYEASNIGAKIKSPVEFLVGLERALPMEIENNDMILYLQKAMGQVLFDPPNVAGWPGGKQWIDSSSLMLRLRTPRLIADGDEFVVTPKSNDDIMGGNSNERDKIKLKKLVGGKIIKANLNWNIISKVFENTPREKLLSEISAALLQTGHLPFANKVMEEYAKKDARISYITSTMVNIMSTPEYQMC